MMNAQRFEAAPTFERYLEEVRDQRALWEGVWAHARLPSGIAARLDVVTAPRKVAVLSEDWCGDAANLVPLLGRLAEAAPGIDVRIFGRDANPDLMDTHLTNGRSRSIPVAIVYDASFRELGWWGSRPRPLQEWVVGEGARLDPEARYREIRRWYARDRGQTLFEELLPLLEGDGTSPAGPGG